LESTGIIGKIRDYIDDRFYFGPKTIIGIDIGLSSIKMAEVTKGKDDTFKIHNFISIDLPEGAFIEDEIQKEDEILKALQKGLRELKSSSKFACIGLFGPNTLVKRLQLGGGTLEEIEDNVNWEIEQYLPFSIDDGNVSFSVVGETSGGGVDVIIGAAKKSVVNSFKELVERTNLKVKIVDLSITAVLNVFEATMPEIAKQVPSTWIIMDMGAQKTQFVIYKNGVMAFFKEISIGGLTITEEIQRQMGVSYQEAESLKIFGDGNGNIPEEILNIMNQVLESFFAELKKTVDFWITSTSDEAFNGCILTGGCSLIPGINEALNEVLETDILIINPFSKMSYNQNKIAEEKIADIAHKGVCAIGLAMRMLQND
jgi:type IV pilus assembly protein PilM